MNNISRASKSFIILFLVALLGTVFCLGLYLHQPAYSPVSYNLNVSKNGDYQQPLDDTPIDVSGWKSYNNSAYHLSFLYDPTWKVLAEKKQGDYTVIQIDPGQKYYNIKIYIGTNGYYAMDGLNTKTISIGGESAIDVGGLLYGVHSGDYYYTFDIGQSLSLKPEFDALVHSVTFGN